MVRYCLIIDWFLLRCLDVVVHALETLELERRGVMVLLMLLWFLNGSFIVTAAVISVVTLLLPAANAELVLYSFCDSFGN